jgi:hypothetical protein
MRPTHPIGFWAVYGLAFVALIMATGCGQDEVVAEATLVFEDVGPEDGALTDAIGDLPGTDDVAQDVADIPPDVQPDLAVDGQPDVAVDVEPELPPADTALDVDDGTIEPDSNATDADTTAEPDVLPDATEDVAPDATPDIVPDTMPDVTVDADAAPDTALDATDASDGSDTSDGSVPSDAADAPDVPGFPCPVGGPKPEGCNGVDDDCNGITDDLACEDANLCTVDICTPGSGCSHVSVAVPCSDGSACTANDYCTGGACKPGLPKSCDDSNPCTDDTCDPSTGCVHTNNSAPCGGGGSCVPGAKCVDGSCLPGAAVPCDDGNPCTIDSCLPQTGCKHEAFSGPCTDGDVCTVSDSCNAGTCQPGAAAVCKDFNYCTDDKCDSTKGCVFPPNTLACNDGSDCTPADTCTNGLCIGSKTGCDDGNPCTADDCKGLDCFHIPTQLPCNDGDACTAVDACQPDGSCQGYNALPCDDGNACSDDFCDPKSGCVFKANVLPCNDGSACTDGDACKAGKCLSGKPKTCNDGDPCTDDGCNAKTGCIAAPGTKAVPCDDGSACTVGDTCDKGVCGGTGLIECVDGNPCTTDACDPKSGCVFVANTLACSDGNGCTVDDVCKASACVPGKSVTCDDNEACTDDSCNPLTGLCVFAANANPCDDGNACTAVDGCAAGKCKSGAPVPCVDGNVCTSDACDVAKGCVFAPVPGSCSDGSACTTDDTCVAGTCKAGASLACDDSSVCTKDACEPAVGCVYTDPGPVTCDDGSACTKDDSCKMGKCQPGAAIVCDDGNPCTDDSCVPAKGCVTVPNANPCWDGNACTGDDQCTGGKCVGGAISCEDGNFCTDNTCDPATGCVSLANTLPCNDNTACTQNDACLAGTCQGKKITCDDGNPCTQDSCDAKLGCVAPAVQNGTTCGDVGVCLSGKCSPGSSVNPATSCKAIKAAWPAGPTGIYWLDPDGSGAGTKYQALCEQVKNGGGWLVLNNLWANTLLTLTNELPNEGKCQISASEWRGWDQFNGAGGPGHRCTASPPTKNWPSYSEMIYDSVTLAGYTGNWGETFDLGTDCYSTTTNGYFCAGPPLGLAAPNTQGTELGNGQKETFSRWVQWGATHTEFLIRQREDGGQAEGLVWNGGTIYLR